MKPFPNINEFKEKVMSQHKEKISTCFVTLPEGEIELVEIPNGLKDRYTKTYGVIYALPQAISRFNNKMGKPCFIASKPFIKEKDLIKQCGEKKYSYRFGTRFISQHFDIKVNDDDYMQRVIDEIKKFGLSGSKPYQKLSDHLNKEGLLTKRNKAWTAKNLMSFIALNVK